MRFEYTAAPKMTQPADKLLYNLVSIERRACERTKGKTASLEFFRIRDVCRFLSIVLG